MERRRSLVGRWPSSALAGLGVLAVVTACGDSTGPGIRGSGVTFDLGTESFTAAGDIVFSIEGRPTGDEWAVAADPDSVGGIAVTAFRASATEGRGDLFVLQLQPARTPLLRPLETGTYTPCGPDEACRGRLFRGWRTEVTGWDDWFEVTSGTVDLQALSPTRIRGTFRFTVRSEGGSGPVTLAVENGVFDVPIDGRVGGFVCGLPPSDGCLQQAASAHVPGREGPPGG